MAILAALVVARVASQSRVRRDHLRRAWRRTRRELWGKTARCIGRKSRSSTKSTATRTSARPTTSAATIPAAAKPSRRFSIASKSASNIPAGTTRETTDVAVLVRGYRWWLWLTFIVPISFILIGGGGFLYRAMRWGKSDEHRAATARHALHRVANGSSSPDFPNIPPGADMTNSPGTHLKFRLPISASGTWALVGVLVVCLLWNGIVSIFVVGLVGRLHGRQPAMAARGVHDSLPGDRGVSRCFLLSSTTDRDWDRPNVAGNLRPSVASESGPIGFSSLKPGRLRMNSLEVSLVCEEVARYRQGNRHPDREHLRPSPTTLPSRGVRDPRGGAAGDRMRFVGSVRHDAFVQVGQQRGEVEPAGQGRRPSEWPDFNRSFPVIVYPDDAQGRPGA